MTTTITKNYLSRRIFITISAFAACLLLIASIGFQTLSSFRTDSRFSALFLQLFEKTMRLETELAWSQTQAPSPERVASLASRYRDALAMFSALRATDRTGNSALEARWAALEAEYRIDAEAERARLGLQDSAMPDDLRSIWRGRNAAGASLEETAAEFLKLTQWVVEKRQGNAAGEEIRAMETLRNLSQTKLSHAFHAAADLIGRRTARSAGFALNLLFALALAGLAATIASTLFILRPTQRAILDNQALLMEQRDRARSSEHANREFLATMSHELRTQMNGVISCADVLLATPLSAQQRGPAHSIKEAARTLLDLLGSILELSKIEAAPQRRQESAFSLADITADVVTVLGTQAAAKRLDLGAYVDPTLPQKLKGDGGRIRQVLLHLVGNAVKFTASGGVGIEVRREGGEGASHRVLIAVTDTGIGISKEQKLGIFERFNEAGSAAGGIEGSGLGLSISHQLVRLMGGEIGVDSTVNKGTTFWVRLTLENAAGEAAPAVQPVSFAGRRFLVVDDNAINRRLVRLQLESHGAQVEAVPGANAAIAALAQGESDGRRFDVAVIDQTMPGIDGITLRKMIRQDPRHAGLKLIISASGGIGYDQQARALGFDAACPKPVIQDVLIAKIRNLLAATEATRPADAPSVAAAPTAIDGPPVADAAIIANAPTIADGPTVAAAPIAADAPVAAPAAPIAVLPSKPAAAPEPRGKPRQARLLVAEDNPINQRLIVTALKQARFAVDIVSDGLEAVQEVQKQEYDLVLMDIRMPVMNGVEATQHIRALPGPAGKIPIIAMTANAMAGDREQYLAAGMDDYVAKPLDFNVLLTKLRAHLPLHLAETTASTAEAIPWLAEKKRG